MHAAGVEVASVRLELSLQVSGIPVEHMVQELTSYAPHQAFDKRMRPWNQRHRLHRLDFENPQIGTPELKREQWIVVETELDGKVFSGNDLVEHAAQSRAIHGDGLHRKANQATTELVHHHQHPVTLEQDGFAPEQVQAP